MPKINAQDIASYVAVVVAAVALYVGWDQARIGRNQQHADVFPVIQIESNNIVIETDDGGLARRLLLKASNAGVGPAFVESGTWNIDGKLISRVSDLYSVLPPDLTVLNEYQGTHEQFLLAAGKDFVIWEVVWPNDQKSNQLSAEFLEKFWKMDLSLCYCSLYERCWVTEYISQSPRPKPVDSCPVRKTD